MDAPDYHFYHSNQRSLAGHQKISALEEIPLQEMKRGSMNRGHGNLAYNNNNENHNNHTMSKEAFHRAQSLNTAHLPTNFDFYRPSEDDLTFDDDASLAEGSPNNVRKGKGVRVPMKNTKARNSKMLLTKHHSLEQSIDRDNIYMI